ncbi:MAG TPA: TonB-dependent receptor [Terriglobia bacterium]|nr:TonB-dependent receptor [Terriglobia bacterium]
MKISGRTGCILLLACGICALSAPALPQQSLGSITGTVTDSTGAVVPNATVKAHNSATGLDRSTASNRAGSYEFFGLPIGTYAVSFTKENFKTETHSEITVEANRTTTVDAVLEPGAVTTTVEVTATPRMNSVDTTNGYVLPSSVIQAIPLGTGSFTQLAILSPGVSADFLNDSGTNGGLGNQSIFANGQRDTSNSFSLNDINANNVFNGKSSSSVSANRFVLSTGENFLAGGQIQTSTSVYNAIGQGLPTPPPETLDELRVNTAMYDASQGANSGAHIEVITRSGTNSSHGQAYEYFQNDVLNASPFFYNAASLPKPSLQRNTFGGTLGGPIKRDKMFFFASYQGIRVRDGLNSQSFTSVPINLTNDRSAAALAQEFSTTDNPITPSQIDPASLALANYKLPNGQYLIPTPTITDLNTATALGYDVVTQGPKSTFNANQVNGNIDYNFSSKDRLAGKYYFQSDPTTSAFAISNASGFPQQLSAGSQVISLANTTVLSPTVTWEQKAGFIRQSAFATTSQALTPQAVGINLFGNTRFPGINFDNFDQTFPSSQYSTFGLGPTSPFSNAGVFQNQWELGSTVNWVRGKHTFFFGANYDRNQLNIVNLNNEFAGLEFLTFPDFLTGSLRIGQEFSRLFQGASNRYYRSNQLGAFAQDNIKLSPALTLTLGLRFDYDGPLSEKYGRLSNFYPSLYQYNLSSDTIVNSGLVIAGNNPNYHTPGVSTSTLVNNQYGFAPRIGLAYSPSFVKNVVVRAGFGMYYDRGEFFTEFSPSAGSGFNGPFGVTLEPPFVLPVLSGPSDTLSNPFGTTPPPLPSGNPAAFSALLPNINALINCSFSQNSGSTPLPNCPAGNQFGPFLFGGYDPANKLPYSENWLFDIQWQPVNNLVLTLAYVGNHGVHGVQPIPFNQPKIATTQNPVNGQVYSFGYNAIDSMGSCIPAESVPGQNGTCVNTPTGGNTDLRVPYIGYSPNSVYYEAEGISNYNALEFSVNKRLSHGLQINGSYTWSHSLDEGSGLGLFFNGNDPLNLRSAYGSSDFDRTHVFNISYLYQFPTSGSASSVVKQLVNGWSISGITTLESGQPYSVYDYSGAVASLYYSANDFITNPLVPLVSGQTSQSAQLQGTTGVNAGKPVLNVNSFGIPLVQPGQSGVPPCQTTVNGEMVCDNVETTYGDAGRNLFRGPFQTRWDFAIQKATKLSERFNLNFRTDFLNLFNHPSFDTPNNNVTFNPCYNPQPCYTFPPHGSLGLIQHPLGSPRFIQMSLHLTF